MKIYAIDWATKKDLAITKDGEKVKFIPATIESFDKFLNSLDGNKCQFYFEEGGGDSFKLLANRNKHKVFTTPGRNTDERREKLGIEKTDENDVKIIFNMAKNNPELFREFAELDVKTANICMRFKSRSDAEKNKVRAKNRLYALKIRSELLEMGKSKEKMIKQKENIIKELEKDFKLETKELDKVVKAHPIYINYLKDIKGIGPACAGGLIAGIKRASEHGNKYSLRHYAGMLHYDKNKPWRPNNVLKRALYFFAEEIIKNRTPKWRELYDNMKIYYANKHPDWRKNLIDKYAKKFVQTKFLDEMYKKMVEVENAKP